MMISRHLKCTELYVFSVCFLYVFFVCFVTVLHPYTFLYMHLYVPTFFIMSLTT